MSNRICLIPWMVAKSCTMQDGRNQASGMFCTASLLSCAGNPCGGHNPYYFISLRCICRKYVFIYIYIHMYEENVLNITVL